MEYLILMFDGTIWDGVYEHSYPRKGVKTFVEKKKQTGCINFRWKTPRWALWASRENTSYGVDKLLVKDPEIGEILAENFEMGVWTWWKNLRACVWTSGGKLKSSGE